NIVIIRSNQVAQEFSRTFSDLEDGMMEAYIDHLAQLWPNEAVDWIKEISFMLYNESSRFRDILNARWDSSSDTERKRLEKHFPSRTMKRARTAEFDDPITPKQRSFLISLGGSPEGLTKQEASRKIGAIL